MLERTFSYSAGQECMHRSTKTAACPMTYPFLHQFAQVPNLGARRGLLTCNLTRAHGFMTGALEEEPASYVYPPEAGAHAQGDLLHFFSDKEGPNAVWVWANYNMVELFYRQALFNAFWQMGLRYVGSFPIGAMGSLAQRCLCYGTKRIREAPAGCALTTRNRFHGSCFSGLAWRHKPSYYTPIRPT
jgi:hypothetical protein